MNDPALRTDRVLFEAASSGDAQAFAELAGRHARGLYDFALRGTLDEQQADAVLDAVFRRIRDPETVVPGQIDFRTWLYSLGLVEVLAVSNETRTARISTDDERFFRPTTDLDEEIAHWAWQAARGLRTRDYCVLDLTLRRGLTPEEVAEAASLTRSNLYASIGRARGAFEETFAAMLLFEHGREACAELDEMVETAPGTSLRPALRHQIIEHSDDCDACRRTLDSLPLAANVYVSLADIEMPNASGRSVLDGPSAVVPAEPMAALPVVAAEPATATSAAFAAGSAALELTEEAGEDEDEWEEADETGDEDEDEQDDDAGEDEEPQDEQPEDEEPEDERELTPVGAVPAGAPLLSRGPVPAPVTPVHHAPAPFEYEETFGDHVAAWVDRARGQPLLWTYALLGIAAVLAIYLGVAVADSLQSGGSDSGALPLDTPPGLAVAREIDCGDAPIEVDAGTSTLISIDEAALDGYQISTLSFTPMSEQARDEDLEATLEDPFSIRFVAKQQDALAPHTDEFELHIQWQRDAEAASSTCQLLVHVSP